MPRTTAKSFPSFGTQSLQIHDRSLEVGFAFGSVGAEFSKMMVFIHTASMVKSPAGREKGTGILMPPNPPAALCIPRDGLLSIPTAPKTTLFSSMGPKNDKVTAQGYISLQCLHELLGPGTRNGNQVVHQICFGQSNAAVNNGKSLAGLDVDGSGDDGGGGGYGGGGGRGSGHWC
ncbi:hypothetical protein HKD37_09G024056 [Glycine soja]